MPQFVRDMQRDSPIRLARYIEDELSEWRLLRTDVELARKLNLSLQDHLIEHEHPCNIAPMFTRPTPIISRLQLAETASDTNPTAYSDSVIQTTLFDAVNQLKDVYKKYQVLLQSLVEREKTQENLCAAKDTSNEKVLAKIANAMSQRNNQLLRAIQNCGDRLTQLEKENFTDTAPLAKVQLMAYTIY
jgi:hypothetical protein